MSTLEFDAIVYTSNAGHTKAYAEMLGKMTGLPVYDFHGARRLLIADSKIIYLGWLMAGKIKGYSQANKEFNVKALCGVGMASGESQLSDMRKSNQSLKNCHCFICRVGLKLISSKVFIS